MTITTPPGFTPEDVMRTVLENHKLPPYIRQPFVELARAKAPHLLAQTMQVAARTELGAVR
ncbi:MAG: hypothetical protein HY596_04635 [Candidatus Omnitrophica bacterium]|nr:hypothetical protein [Candidatus Omnitrophota bacterium]